MGKPLWDGLLKNVAHYTCDSPFGKSEGYECVGDVSAGITPKQMRRDTTDAIDSSVASIGRRLGSDSAERLLRALLL